MLRCTFWVVEETTQDMSGYHHSTNDWYVFMSRDEAREYLKDIRLEYPDKSYRIARFIRSYEKV